MLSMKNMINKWGDQKYAYLKKKKSNGHPHGREVGERLEILEIDFNPKYTKMRIRGDRHLDDSFHLHESYLMTVAEKREETIESILDDNEDIVYLSDNSRHLICYPYSIENLHKMAEQLDIKKCWFHKNHYDIPKKRISEIKSKTKNISSKNIVNIINGKRLEEVI